MKLIIILAILVALSGCTSTATTQAFGNSRAAVVRGDNMTITDTFTGDALAGRVTVCEGHCFSEESDSRDNDRSLTEWISTIGAILVGTVLF